MSEHEAAGARVLAEVDDLLPAVAERAEDAEDARDLPPETIKSLRQAGVFKLLQPRRYDGFEANPLVFYEAVRRIAGGCGSSGWVASVLGVHPWHLGLFPDEAQREVWDAGPDVLISSAYAPVGRAHPVAGGFRLSGRWSFSSGCGHTTWSLLGGIVLDGAEPTDFRTFLLPVGDYTTDDVWDTVGLRGTGSNDIIVDDAFVPEHRTLSFQHMAKCACPGQEVNAGPLFRMPYGTVHPYAITAPVIGMATGAYRAYLEQTAGRVRTSYSGAKEAEDAFTQVRIAAAASDIDAAWLQLEANLTATFELAGAGQRIPLNLRLRSRRDQVLGTARAIAAIDRLWDGAGGKAIGTRTALSRFWRDAHAANAHAANDVERALVMYGRSELGLPVREGLF